MYIETIPTVVIATTIKIIDALIFQLKLKLKSLFKKRKFLVKGWQL